MKLFLKLRIGKFFLAWCLCGLSIDMFSSSTDSSASFKVSATPSSVISKVSDVLEAVNDSESTPSQAAYESEADIREKIELDLMNWQEKFSKAADKGTEDLEGRVKDIINRQIGSQVDGVGRALIVQLEDTSASIIAKIKGAISNTVAALREDPSDEDVKAASEKLLEEFRDAGQVIKKKAQALKKWRQKYDEDTTSLVRAACESTLEVMDTIRDAGLQEIGNRWASMDSVTYKDWSKYHALKKTLTTGGPE